MFVFYWRPGREKMPASSKRRVLTKHQPLIDAGGSEARGIY